MPLGILIISAHQKKNDIGDMVLFSE